MSTGVLKWAASFKGGGWSLIGADGYAIPSALLPGPVNASAFIILNGGGSCSYSSLTATNQTFVIPATSGNLSSGNTSYWRIDMGGGQNQVLTVVELSGSIYPLAEGTCADNNETVRFQAVTPVVVDSSVAAGTAWTAGGDAYVANHSGYVVGYAVSAGIETFGRYFAPHWYVQYQICSPGSTFSASPGFVATANATTGALIQTTMSSGGCPPVG